MKDFKLIKVFKTFIFVKTTCVFVILKFSVRKKVS